MDDFLTRAKAREGRKAPVRQAVERNWQRIAAAMAANVSLTNIYKELCLEGEPVGRNLSSFTSVIRHIKTSRDEGEVSQANPNRQASSASDSSPARFADDRFPQSEF